MIDTIAPRYDVVMTRARVLLAALALVGCVVEPLDEVGDGTETNGDGDGDGDTGDGDTGDGDGDTGDGDGDSGDGDGDSGDGDGDSGDGDGDSGDGDGDSGDGDTDGCGGDGDGDYPGLCSCEPADEPCYQGCQAFAEGLTCDTVCASVGETCVAYGCGSNTASGGNDAICPGPGEEPPLFFGIACDEPLPVMGNDLYECCCTRT
jgi:hypothetical protein